MAWVVTAEYSARVTSVALSELLGVPVLDAKGSTLGRVREVALCPQEHATQICAMIVRTKAGDRMLGPKDLQQVTRKGVRVGTAPDQWPQLVSSEGMLLLERDLLDQQIIDVHGRKVVRVNDVELQPEQANGNVTLRVAQVDVGARGAVRRLVKGLFPREALAGLLARIPSKQIPWEFVDLIETDPARRVRLKIEMERLQKLHPADIADILEELAPSEREAVFESLDEEVAAEALEEIEDPKMKRAIIESLDSEHAADIVEEMNPDAAADLLGELPQATSEEILQEMEPEEREEVEELLEFREDTAAGRMTTDYVSAPANATVEQVIEALRTFEGGVENLTTVFLVDADEKLAGAVPISSIVLAKGGTAAKELAPEQVIACHAGANEREVAELFDKYNLMALPVVDEEGKLTGVITADDVISLLRDKL